MPSCGVSEQDLTADHQCGACKEGFQLTETWLLLAGPWWLGGAFTEGGCRNEGPASVDTASARAAYLSLPSWKL